MSRERLLEMVEKLNLNSAQYKDLAEEIAKIPHKKTGKIKLTILYPYSICKSSSCDTHILCNNDIDSFSFELEEDSLNIHQWEIWLKLCEAPFHVEDIHILNSLLPEKYRDLLNQLVFHSHRKSVVQLKLPMGCDSDDDDDSEPSVDLDVISHATQVVINVLRIS